jgi:hypothetical protein
MNSAINARYGMQSFADAPKSANGRNPFLGVLDGLVRQIEQGTISPQLEHSLIYQAGYFAKRNGLSFTPTLRGVVAMVAKADELHRLHMQALAQAERNEFNPEITGFDKVSGFER